MRKEIDGVGILEPGDAAAMGAARPPMEPVSTARAKRETTSSLNGVSSAMVSSRRARRSFSSVTLVLSRSICAILLGPSAGTGRAGRRRLGVRVKALDPVDEEGIGEQTEDREE